MVEITDENMQQRLQTVRAYTTILLKKGPVYQLHSARSPEQAKIVLEHGRRNMKLSAEGKMPLVGPLHGAGDIVGLCVFSVPEDEARVLMDGDGAVQAGVFVYDVVTWYGFPGDALP